MVQPQRLWNDKLRKYEEITPLREMVSPSITDATWAFQKPKQIKGRTVAINMIFDVLLETRNAERFKYDLQEAFNDNPLDYYERFVKYLQPREFVLDINSQHVEARIDLTKLSDSDLSKLENLLDKAETQDAIDV